jgi:hypothetical protein
MTKGQEKILKFLRNNPDEDIIMDGNKAYYGNNRTSVAMVYSLLRLCAISQDPHSDVRFQLNSTGKELISK